LKRKLFQHGADRNCCDDSFEVAGSWQLRNIVPYERFNTGDWLWVVEVNLFRVFANETSTFSDGRMMT
jgi:hypothetical protein